MVCDGSGLSSLETGSLYIHMPLFFSDNDDAFYTSKDMLTVSGPDSVGAAGGPSPVPPSFFRPTKSRNNSLSEMLTQGSITSVASMDSGGLQTD